LPTGIYHSPCILSNYSHIINKLINGKNFIQDDKVYGEGIKAFVVLEPQEQASEEEIIAFCKEQLPTFKTPKKVRFIETLPKNILGNVLRAELRNLA
jgi:acyl-CoA synthetase (AMP-forming)/AMP-acid ligase II